MNHLKILIILKKFNYITIKKAKKKKKDTDSLEKTQGGQKFAKHLQKVNIQHGHLHP